MNFNKKNKKGFGIVELVIVIAVIGILAAILIPSFIGKNNQVNNETNIDNEVSVATDSMLIKELNHALALDLEETGKTKYDTMYDVLKATENHGFVVQRIKSVTNKNKILWDSKNGVFCYLTETGIEYEPNTVKQEDRLAKDSYELWEIANDVDGNSPFSTYLYNYNPTGERVITTSKGFDAGDENVETVTYERASGETQNVVIRTNGGKLIINDSTKSSIKHYNKVASLDVVKCYTSSYHEYGDVSYVNIKEGHVSFEQDSSVEAVHFEKSDREGKEETEPDTYNTIIISFAQGVEQPEYSRDKTIIDPNDGTKVCTLNLPEETNNIYLTLQGIYEQIKVEPADVTGIGTDDAVWVNTSDSTDETKRAADQIANQYRNRVSALDPGAEEAKVVGVDDVEGERVFVLDEEQVSETGENKETVEAIVTIAKAYTSQIEDMPIVNTILNIAGNDAPSLPSSAKLDTAYLFKAFEDSEDALAFKNLLEALNITDDSQLGLLTLDTIDEALETIEDEAVKNRLRSIVNSRIDYLGWRADFTVCFDADVEVNTVVLAGAYETYANGEWLGFGLPELAAGEEVRLLDTAYDMFEEEVFHMSYLQICAWVQEFSCGVANLDNSNAGKTITVSLKLYEVENGVETGRVLNVCSMSFNLPTVNNYNRNVLNNMI